MWLSFVKGIVKYRETRVHYALSCFGKWLLLFFYFYQLICTSIIAVMYDFQFNILQVLTACAIWWTVGSVRSYAQTILYRSCKNADSGRCVTSFCS